MDESRTREILGNLVCDKHVSSIQFFDGIQREDMGPRSILVFYENGIMYSIVNGVFNTDELEAIAWWMRNKT